MVTETISLLEVISMLLVLAGSGLVGFCLYLVFNDLRVYRNSTGFRRNSAKHRIAKRNVRTELAKLSTLFFFIIAIGILMTITPRNNNPHNVGSVVTIFAILYSFAAMIVDSILYLWDRSAILNLIQSDSEREVEPAARTTLVRGADGQDMLLVPVDVDEGEK